jgi:hypothetical protein
MPRSAALNASATRSGDPSGGTEVVGADDAGAAVDAMVDVPTSTELGASVACS